MKLNFQQMRKLDHWLGLPLCDALGAWVTLTGGRRKPAIPEHPRTIVVLKWFGLGSLVLMQPLLRAIKTRYPQARLIVMTFRGNEKILELFGFCDEIRTIRMDGLFVFLRDTARNLARWGWHGADIAIDLEFYSKFSTLMAFFSGARVRVGFDLSFFWRNSLLTHGVYLNYYKHIGEMYRMAGRMIGVDYEDLAPPKVVLAPETGRDAQGLLKERGWTGAGKLIGINVNASEMMFSRRWKRESFIALMERVASEGRGAWWMVLTGTRSEAAYTKEIYGALSPEARACTLDLAGALDLKDFIGLLERMDLLVTNDSGPLHFATAQGTPTVSLWGPGTPFMYGPPPAGRHKIFYLGLDCSPCHYVYFTEPGKHCGQRIDCLNQLEPGPVAEYICRFMRGEAEG